MNCSRRKISVSAMAFLAGCTPLGRNQAKPWDGISATESSLATSSHRIKDSAQARMQGYIPNVELTNEKNQKVLFYDDLVRGKVVMINFIYTACSGICPLSTANLIQVQKGFGNHLGRDVFMYSITLDPVTDTPEVLERYANAFGAKPGWSFLTGDFDDIELLRHRLGIFDPDPVLDADKTQHGGLFVYGNEAIGKWTSGPSMWKPSEIVRSVLRVM